MSLTKKSHGNTKAIGFFYFIYLSYVQDCWALIYLTLIHERQALILKGS